MPLLLCHTRLDRVSMPSAAMDTRIRGHDKFPCLSPPARLNRGNFRVRSHNAVTAAGTAAMTTALTAAVTTTSIR